MEGILKQILLLSFALLSLLSTCLCLEIPVTAQTVNNPYELVAATVGEPETVDPAWAYDIKSRELIFNIYETLIAYDRESVDKFVPVLAMEWTVSPDGLTYTFKIREGVKFHDNATLSPKDVEYSFERAMVQDRADGPQWMLYEALLGCKGSRNAAGDMQVTASEIDHAVESFVNVSGNYIQFNLVKPYAPFLQILCQSWSSVVNKRFCVEHGCWDGNWKHWIDNNNPDVSPLDSPEPVMCGTGPYAFDYWERGVEWAVIKFDEYWGGWPALGCTGYVRRVTAKKIQEWAARRDGFLAGDYDLVYVPGWEEKTYWGQVAGQPGIRYIYPLRQLEVTCMFFTLNISTTSIVMAIPGGLPPSTFNETGIPPDFFNDTDVRKGFAYSINYTQYIEDAFLGDAVQPASPVIEGLPYTNPAQQRYSFDLDKAEKCFRKAWNGQLWAKGFSMYLLYSGDLRSEMAYRILESNIESLNPKFHIEVLEVAGPIFPECQMLPLFIMDWPIRHDHWRIYTLVSHTDPHDFITPFMHSMGTLSVWQRYNNSHVDELIEEGLRTVDPQSRREIYYELQSIYHNECPSVPLAQPIRRHWERTWVQGWYYNPAYPGLYFYHLWKEDLPPEDLNMNGIVNIRDITIAAIAFGSYCSLPDVHPRWNSRADFNQDQNVDIRDIAAIASKFGSRTAPWQPP